MKFPLFLFLCVQITFAHGGLTPVMFLPVGLILLVVAGLPAFISYKASSRFRWLKAFGAGLGAIAILCVFVYHM